MDSFHEFGHTFFIGQTNSGKTHLAKYVINQFKPAKHWVFCDPSAKEWDAHPHSTKFDENIDKLCAIAQKQEKECIIVFDDFNDHIDTRRNEKYNKLYTRGRKQNIRVFNMLHNANAVGPTARNNVRFIYIMSSFRDQNTLKELAKSYLDGNYKLLVETLQQASNRSKYAAVLIDRASTNKLDVVLAPPLKKVEQKDDLEDLDKTLIPVMPNPDSPMSNGQQTAFNGLSPSFSIGNKSAHNLLDQSNNNFQLTPNITQMSNVFQQQHQQKIQNFEYEYKEKKEQRKYQALEMLQNPYLSYSDRIKLLTIFNQMLNPTIKGKPYVFPMEKFDMAKKMFVLQYFPDASYLIAQKSNPTASALMTAAQYHQEDSLVGKANIAFSAASALAPNYTSQLPAALSNTVGRLLK